MQLDPYAQMPKKLMLIRAISGTIKGIQQMPTIWLVMLTNAQYSVLLWWSLSEYFIHPEGMNKVVVREGGEAFFPPFRLLYSLTTFCFL